MNNDVSNLKKMTSNEIYDYLYKTGLSNIFDDYKKQRELLSANAKKNIEDMNALNEIQKRYLGEYASNIGLGDVSDSLQSLANDYVKNLTGIKQDEANQQMSLESAYKSAQQEAYNAYAGNILQQKLSQEEQDAQIAQEILSQGLASGFYGYGEDGQKLSLQEFLDKPEYANLSDAYKKYLLDQEQYVKEIQDLGKLTVDTPDQKTGISLNKDMIADYLIENISSYDNVNRNEIRKFMQRDGEITLAGKSLKISNKSIGFTDANNNYYVAVDDTVDKTKAKDYKQITNATLATTGELNSLYKEQNDNQIPVKGAIVQHEDSDGRVNYYYFDGANWHCAIRIGSATSGKYAEWFNNRTDLQKMFTGDLDIRDKFDTEYGKELLKKAGEALSKVGSR